MQPHAAYQPELWRDLYVMLGTSAAALIGLLFVATSLHLDDLVRNPAYHTRAYNQTRYLVLLLVEAVFVLVPQPPALFGAEVALLNAVGISLPLSNIYSFVYKNKAAAVPGGWAIGRALRYIVAFAIGMVGGAMIAAGLGWGIYLVTAGHVLLLVAVIDNAWSIMVGVGRKA